MYKVSPPRRSVDDRSDPGSTRPVHVADHLMGADRAFGFAESATEQTHPEAEQEQTSGGDRPGEREV